MPKTVKTSVGLSV